MFSYTLGVGTPVHCQLHCQLHAHQRITHAHSCASRTIASKPIVFHLHAAVIEQKTAEFCLAHRFLMGKASFLLG